MMRDNCNSQGNVRFCRARHEYTFHCKMEGRVDEKAQTKFKYNRAEKGRIV